MKRLQKVFRSIRFSVFILAAGLIYLNFTVFSYVFSIDSQLGRYIYPLDDTYIHLSIAKNFAGHGIWGVTRYDFASASSSPLYTLIIAVFIKIFGNSQIYPLYLNIFFGNLIFLSLFMFFKRNPLLLLLIYAGFLWGALLKVQIVSGMEHTFHILVVSSVLLLFFKWYESGFLLKIYRNLFYFFVGISCLIRYESLFLVAAAIFYLSLIRKYKNAYITAIFALTPVIIFGLYSMNNGGHFFPNSVLAKGGQTSHISVAVQRFFSGIEYLFTSFYAYIFFILLILTFLGIDFRSKLTAKSFQKYFTENYIALFIFLNLIWHFTFASTGWLFRYDAYLIAMSFTGAALIIKSTPKRSKTVFFTCGILSVFLIFSFKERIEKSKKILEFASKNIHDQQIQTAEFLNEYYHHSKVIANDIGAITYFTDIKLYDLFGLASTEILDLKKKTPAESDQYINSLPYDIMIVYDTWFKRYNFKARTKVAELIIFNNKICGHHTVSFYIPKNRQDKDYAIKSLQKFRKTLPKDVVLRIFY